MVPQVSSDTAGVLDYPRRLGEDGVFFAFGGGVGKFGTNFTLFHHGLSTVWIDCGAGFANRHTPGMDKSLPNRQLLLGFPPSAIILTHGHEDHIGALPHLTEVIPQGTPIYASPFTTALVVNRLKDRGIDPTRWKFCLVEDNTQFSVGAFRVHTFFMPHSIPQTFSVGIEVDLPLEGTQRIYFTSDFKLKGDEVRHKVSLLKKFAPVDYLFIDSTGALAEGESADERSVGESLAKLIASIKGRIFLTTFSSQIERIRALAKITKDTGRPLGFLGRSIKGHLEAAFQAKEISEALHLRKQPPFSSQNALWVVAGCQADKFSSFTRLTQGMMPKLKLKAGDSLIYSASMIPGNDGPILECLNNAAALGVEVIGLGKEHHVHASGHGKRGDMEKLISYLKPRHIIPVHGDPLHLRSFLKWAQDKKTTVTVTEGHKIYALKDSVRFVESVLDETCLVEGAEIHFEERLYRDRVHLGEAGVCIAVLDKSRMELQNLTYTGVMSQEFQQKMLPQLFNEAAKITASFRGSQKENFEKKFRVGLGRVHEEKLDATPYIQVILI